MAAVTLYVSAILFVFGLQYVYEPVPMPLLILCRTQVAIERSPVVKAIADRLNVSAVAVVLCWTLGRNVVIIPRTANPDKIVENIAVGAEHCVAYLVFNDHLGTEHSVMLEL